jgi:hypothetical protein
MSEHQSELEEWMEAVARRLAIEEHVDLEHVREVVLDLARDVAHGVARPAAPVTAFLVGLAAGRSADAKDALDELAVTVRQLIPDEGFTSG